jgi:DNA polymerase-3 subunit alpha
MFLPLILKIFKQRIQEIQLIGLQHINLKQASDKIRLTVWRQTGLEEYQSELLENKKSFGKRPNTRICTIIRSFRCCNLIGISPLILQTKNGLPAVAMTDTANMMGAFPFVSAVMNHNKAASSKMQPW